jgi:hypothetical protein
MYGMGDDIAYYSEEARNWKELVKLAKNEILEKVMASDKSSEEKIRLIALLNEVD